MPAKQPRADDLEFRQQVLSRLDVLTAYVQRERSILVEQIRDLRQQLQQFLRTGLRLLPNRCRYCAARQEQRATHK